MESHDHSIKRSLKSPSEILEEVVIEVFLNGGFKLILNEIYFMSSTKKVV